MLTRQWCVGHAGGVYMKLVYEEAEDLMETFRHARLNSMAGYVCLLAYVCDK